MASRPGSAQAMTQLTRRQWAAAQLLLAGKSYKQIALELGISHSAARSRLHKLYKNLGVSNPPQALLRLQELGAVAKPPDPEPPEPREPPLSDGWRAYLRAFDRLVRASSDEAERRAREMRVMFDAAWIDQQLPAPTHLDGPHRMFPGVAEALPNRMLYRRLA